MAESNVPVRSSVQAAVAFWRHYSRPAAGALAVFALASTVQGYFDYTGQRTYALVLLAVVLLTSVLAVGALYRLAFADERPNDPDFAIGPGGLQWGRMEFRLLGVQLLLGLFMMIALAGVLFILMIGALMLGAAALGEATTPEALGAAMAESPGGILLLLLFVILGLAVIYGLVRLVLAQAATAGSGKVMLFETWALTQGQFWPILAAVVIVSAPLILIGMVTATVASELAVEGASGMKTLAPAVAAMLAAVDAGVTAFVQAPLSVGLYAYLYRGLRPPEAAVAPAVHAP